MVDSELAKKLQLRRAKSELEGATFTKKAEAPSADARGEWLIVETDAEEGQADWSLLPTAATGAARGEEAAETVEEGLVQNLIAASKTRLAGAPPANREKPPPRPVVSFLPAARANAEASATTKIVGQANSAPPAEKKQLTERERIEQERALRAADCARRWPRLLPEEEAEGGAEAPDGDSEPFVLEEKDMRVIHADIQRTRAGDPAFQVPEMHTRLENLLTGFCSKERIGYTQGLHEIAAVFAFVRSKAPTGCMDDALALTCFTTFIHRFAPYFHDKEEFVTLHVSLLFFRQLLFYHHPDLHNQLEEANVSPFLYATPWFITLFAARTPLSVLLCFWDKYILRNEACFFPFLAVALLVSRKAAILSAGLDQAHSEVVRAGVKTMDQLEEVWAAAEELRARTPQSYLLRLRQVLEAVKEKRAQPVPSDRSGRVLAQVERERHFLLLPPEIVAYFVIEIRAAAAAAGAEQNGKVSEEGAGEAKEAKDEEGEEKKSEAPVPAPAPAPTPAPSKPIKARMRLLLLDVRPLEEYANEHLPQALHFHPPCLRRLIASSNARGQRRLERLAAALSSAVGSLMPGSSSEENPQDAPGASEQAADDASTPAAGSVQPTREPGSVQHQATSLDASLVAEVLQALKEEAAPRWGEEWITESARAHLVLMGGAADTAEISGENSTAPGGAVATLFEAMTETMSLARVSVVLGGAAAVHREATKRGLELEQGAPAAGRRESLLGSAWSRLQAASEKLPAADSVKEGMGGLLGRGAEAARNWAGVAGEAAGGIAGSETLTSVRQRASYGLSAVWKQLEKFDWEASMNSNEEANRSASKSDDSEAAKIWCCEVWVTGQQGGGEEGAPALVEELEGPAAMRFTAALELQLLACYSDEGGGEGAVAHVFQAEELVRICMPPSRPGVLMFFFPLAAAEAEPGAEEPKPRQPTFLARFETTEQARLCARTIAGYAASAKKRRRAASSAADKPEGEAAAADEPTPSAPEDAEDKGATGEAEEQAKEEEEKTS